MLDQAVRQLIGIHARDGKVQQIFQRFMLCQALQAVAFHAGLHPRTVVFVKVARCHFSHPLSLPFTDFIIYSIKAFANYFIKWNPE